MGKQGRRPRADLPEKPTIWVRTEPTVDGSAYVVTLEVTEDISYAFNRDTAMAYAAYVHEAAAWAEYDAAVIKQLEHIIKVVASFARHHVPEFHSKVNEGVDY